MELRKYEPAPEGSEIPVEEVALERLRRSIKDFEHRQLHLTQKRRSLMNELFRNQEEEKRIEQQVAQLKRSVDSLLAP